jgi:hypothetical protein
MLNRIRSRAMASRAMAKMRSVGARYATTSEAHPHFTAAATAGGVLTVADMAVQLTLQRGYQADGTPLPYDWRRTLGLSLFGVFYYGGFVKWWYLKLDRWFLSSTLSSTKVALSKMFADVYLHTPFILVPAFYMVTDGVKGVSPDKAIAHMKAEWVEASFGSAVMWTPAQALSFAYVPQHSRILYVAILSFLHKTWLSWLSNRERHQQRLEQLGAASNAEDVPQTAVRPSLSTSWPVSMPMPSEDSMPDLELTKGWASHMFFRSCAGVLMLPLI